MSNAITVETTVEPRHAQATGQWLPWAVLALAISVRLVGLGEWSLWEDEETTLYFSQHPDRPFPSAFPVFFLLLRGVFVLTGVSLYAGRLLAFAIGAITLVLTFVLARRFVSPRVALVALVCLAVSPAHLFWSQSIRYYGLVLAFQLASIYWFLRGWTESRLWMLALSTVPLVLALNSHFSGILLLPVYVAFVAWAAWREGMTRAFWTRTLAVGVPAALVLAVWARELMAMQGMLGSWVIPSARDPLHVLATAVVYFGPPAVLLAGMALAFAAYGTWGSASTFAEATADKSALQDPSFVFFSLLAVIPVAELAVIAARGTVNVTYYYGLVALVGVAVLAGYAWDAMHQRGWRTALVVIAAAACLAHGLLFAQYFGPGYGDRPRWKDAAAHVRAALDRRPGPVIVYGSVPGTVAFHLGIPPGETMGHPWMRAFDSEAFTPPGRDTWYVVERRSLTTARAAWLDQTCEAATSFPATFLGRDRTVVVYRCAPRADSGR